jgi:uncharacterized protein (TIGR03067 family)
MPRDLDHLQGAWQISSLEVDGQEMSAEVLEEARIEIKGDRFITAGMGSEYTGTASLNASAKPRQIDMKFDSGPEAGNVNLGIYKLLPDGWKLCLATRGGVRPRKFETTFGSGYALEVLTRASLEYRRKKSEIASKNGRTRTAAAVKASNRSKSTSAPTELEGEWKMVTGVMSGVEMDDSMKKWVKRVTEGNISTVLAGPQTMLKVECTTDASRSPKTIDYMNLAGAHKGKQQAGIYEFEGGVLKICVSGPGMPRPSEFVSKPGDLRAFTVWKKT